MRCMRGGTHSGDTSGPSVQANWRKGYAIHIPSSTPGVSAEKRRALFPVQLKIGQHLACDSYGVKN